MKFIYILEDEERIQKDLYETLKSIDPNLSVRFFLNLDEFHQWLKTALTEGAKSLALGGHQYITDKSAPPTPASTHELRLIIAKNEFLGTKNMGLIKRARYFFLRKKICSEQDPTSLIITAFDSPNFDISIAEDSIINNVIFKPFDKLILRQHLEYALAGHNQVTPTAVAARNISTTIEMLKEVSLTKISEVGFTTSSNHEIQIGSLRKYYGEPFTVNSKRSVFAYCYTCREASPKEFICEFHFFGIDNAQISHIRRNILQSKEHDLAQLERQHKTPTRVLLIEEDEDFANEFKLFLDGKIANLEIYHYTHISQLVSDLAGKDTIRKQNLPSEFNLIFTNLDLLEPEKEKRWEQIKQQLEERAKKQGQSTKGPPPLYLISRKQQSSENIKDLTGWARDIFFAPLDKLYITKKLSLSGIPLSNKSSTNLASIKNESSIDVANAVEITQISEAGLIMKYYRKIAIGSFRNFILPREKENELTKIPAVVNYSEEQKNGEGFLNHFVFFGMKDHYLKYIRLWLLDVHIKTKDKE